MMEPNYSGYPSCSTKLKYQTLPDLVRHTPHQRWKRWSSTEYLLLSLKVETEQLKMGRIESLLLYSVTFTPASDPPPCDE